MSFISSLLAKLHAEFNQVRGASHIPTQLHDLMDELVGRFHALEARVETALQKHDIRDDVRLYAVPIPAPDPSDAIPAPAPAATEEPARLMPASTEAATEAAPSSSDPA